MVVDETSTRDTGLPVKNSLHFYIESNNRCDEKILTMMM